jgi:hypothetical protein
MKKYFLGFATILALTGAPAFAQAAPASDPAATAAVKEMLDAMNYRQMMLAAIGQVSQTLPASMRSMTANMAANNPKLSADDKEKMAAQVEKAIPGAVASFNTMMSDPALIDEMIAEMVPLYANAYTVAEIRQLGAFYQSPLGQKMLANMPKLMADSMAISQRIIGPRVGKMMEQSMQAAVAK